MEDPVVAFEATRMWLGDEPAGFFIEIVFRSLLAYFFCFLLVRFLSGRAVAQMSMTDLVLVIALGSAVGDVAFYADVPILHALVVILVVILATKTLDRLSHNWNPLKAVLDNSPVLLVSDGVIDQRGCSTRDLNSLEVMELLRLKGIRNLGQVECAFFEAAGDVSVFKHKKPKPGLAIVPPHDLSPHPPKFVEPEEGQSRCCKNCGLYLAKPEAGTSECSNCHNDDWTIPTREEG